MPRSRSEITSLPTAKILSGGGLLLKDIRLFIGNFQIMPKNPAQGQIRAGGVTESPLVDGDRGNFVKMLYQINFNTYRPATSFVSPPLLSLHSEFQ